ncbi:thrombospondin type 3 repeat-containing protein [Motilimonas cestriensis]|uniref:Thrombospondin type 3 repeat-containing protein n=1 Tax=Motilimonas cestriensis TaxID=2742685 RepID=A0ABS8WA45_9GAMM|nr:thrombospondin type 3 repeat-containing protein [Motilimonas cestriensis]MCE2594621.1 thrombospondin type 3 repeat-containing protein [Motilimonas cestriensis]
MVNKIAVGVLLMAGVNAFANAAIVDAKSHQGIVYLTDEISTEIKRYSLADEKFLTPIALSNIPLALAVDETGIFVSYGSQITKLALDGSNETQLRVTTKSISDLEIIDDILILSTSSYIQTVNKSSGQFIADKSLWYASGEMTVLPSSSNVYFHSSGISPSDINRLDISATGVIGSQQDSPYHGAYNQGRDIAVFPDNSRLVDYSGIIYNQDLTYSASLGTAFKDIDFWGDLPIVLRGNQIHAYDKASRETGTYSLSLANPDQLFVHDNKVVVFADDLTHVEVFAVSQLNPADPQAAIDPTDLAYTPDTVVLDDNEDVVYLLSKQHLNIFRWSISQQQYLPSIGLTSAPSAISYSPAHNRIYLAYSNNQISYIDLNTNTESVFINLPNSISTISATGNYLMTRDSTGAWGTFSIFNSAGEKTHSNEWAYPTSSLVWGEQANRVYYISGYSPADLHWHYLDPETGSLGGDNDSPYHSSQGWQVPIRVSENGAFVALGSGRIVLGRSMSEVTNLSLTGNIEDLTWLHGNVFTLRGADSNTYTQLHRWQGDFSLDAAATYEVQGTPLAILSLASKGQILLAYAQAGVPTFELKDFTAKDFDGDGYNDQEDLFPADPNDWADFDRDEIGDTLDTDDDNDGVDDGVDAFPFDASESLDTDADGIGNNADTDDDNDGVADGDDAFPLDATETIDTDGDGLGNNADTDDDNDNVADSVDVFPLDPSEALDSDLDGIGNNADNDDDNDGIADSVDAFPLDSSESVDSDLDGIGNNADTDDDNDGVADNIDAFPFNPNESVDSDLDGVGNNADNDDDNDGVLDVNDAAPLDASIGASSNDNDSGSTDTGSDTDTGGADNGNSDNSNTDGTGEQPSTDDGQTEEPQPATPFGGDYSTLFPATAGNTWYFDTFANQEVKLGAAQTMLQQKVYPLVFPSGSKLHLNASSQDLQLLGLHLAQVSTPYGTFSADIRLDKAISLARSVSLNGRSKVNIQPEYGNRDFVWNASSTAYGFEQVTVAAGTYNALRSELNLSGYAEVDGAKVQFSYQAQYWFVENIGLVKLVENGVTTQLTRASIKVIDKAGETDTSNGGSTDNTATAEKSGGGGGGSLGWFSLIMLAGLALLRKRS